MYEAQSAAAKQGEPAARPALVPGIGVVEAQEKGVGVGVPPYP